MVTIQFHGTKNSTEGAKAEVYHTEDNEIRLIVNAIDHAPRIITMDKRTAIKFCRQLRMSISQLED